MIPVLSFIFEMSVTLLAATLIMTYFRPSLRKILADLCGTEDRANFWTTFANILLIGTPVILSLNFRPDTQDGQGLFFEIVGKLSGNLIGFLFSLVCTGVVISFFSLFAPKTKAEAK